MISEWIKDERKRLGLTQPAFADIAGVKKRTIIDWEKGASSPTAVQMSALFKAGADVQYIVTGMRSNSVSQVAEKPLTNGKCDTVSHLPLDEQMLLLAFRALNQAGKNEALGWISQLASDDSTLSTTEEKQSNAKFIVHGNVGQSVESQTASHVTIDMREGQKKKG